MKEADRPHPRLPKMRSNLPALRELAETAAPGGSLVEIGSFAGESTRIFLEAGLHVHAIDPWDDAYRFRLREGARDDDSACVWDLDMRAVERTFDALLTSFRGRLTKRKGYDWEFVGEYPEESLDAVYIDSIHTYEETFATIRRWTEKVRPGGLICGHDFSPLFPGVQRAVREAFDQPDRTFGDTSWMVRRPAALCASRAVSAPPRIGRVAAERRRD